MGLATSCPLDGATTTTLLLRGGVGVAVAWGARVAVGSTVGAGAVVTVATGEGAVVGAGV